jgi:hypothetical protein
MKTNLKIAMAISILQATASLYAQEDLVRGRLGISQNNFSSIYSGGPMKSDYQSLNAGLTFIRPSGWYFDAGVKNSISAKWSLNGAGTDSGSSIGNGTDSFKRQDLTFTVGKALDDGIQVFGGYQQANSSIDLGSSVNNYIEKFNVRGYFVGAGKTFPLSVGSINLNGAVGQMKARLLDATATWNDSNSGSGYSVGATYSYPLAEKTTLSFEYKFQAYNYKFGSSSPNTGGDDKLQVLGANISYRF